MSSTDCYAVVGNPIAHSQSPAIHAAFARQTGQAMDYVRLLAPLDGFEATVRDFVARGGKGLNVTVPFKLEAHALATELTPRARAAGAVNTLRFMPSVGAGFSILGDNTDGVGLVADITRNAGLSLQNKTILLLGAGGAARGVLLPLLAQHPARLIIANRTRARAQALAQQYADTATAIDVLDYADLTAPAKAVDLIVNATSASLEASMPPLSPTWLAPHTLAYDMMYAREPSVFLQFALQHGAQARDGLGMLVEQAAESFALWRGVRPETDPVLAALRARLQADA